MKKYIIVSIISVFLVSSNAMANTKEVVTLSRCIDGDTARFYINGEEKSVRFLAINAPEYTKEKEPYGKEASSKVCQLLKNANQIMLEYDDEGTKYDKYNRVLAWVWADDKLVQKVLVQEGLAEVKYLYGDYQYNDELKKLEKQAKEKQLSIWSNQENQITPLWKYMVYAVGIVVIIILSLTRKRGNKTKVNKVKKVLKQIKKL